MKSIRFALNSTRDVASKSTVRSISDTIMATTEKSKEGVLKTIIDEVYQSCMMKAEGINETLVAYMTKAVVLNPDFGFDSKQGFSKSEVRRLVKSVTDLLTQKDSITLETMKMQVYFDMNYAPRDQFSKEHRRELKNRLKPLMRELTETYTRSTDTMEILYKKMATYVVLNSSTGDPNHPAVMREVMAALGSIFSVKEMVPFMSLRRVERERQLEELTLLVTGIRLFNWECSKGGIGIEHLPKMLEAAVPNTVKHMQEELIQIRKDAFAYTALLEGIHRGGEFRGLDRELIVEALVNCRQYESFMRVLNEELQGVARDLINHQEDLNVFLDRLKETVYKKSAVPTTHVYPQFVQLANLWAGYQDLALQVSVFGLIISNLEGFIKMTRRLLPLSQLQPYLEKVKILTDDERINRRCRLDEKVCTSNKCVASQEWYFPETTRNFEKIKLQYKGYCAFSLAQHDRFLLPGCPNVGVMHHRGFYYAFSSKAAAETFAENPDRFVRRVGEFAKRHPELIQLLELHTHFKMLVAEGEDKPFYAQLIKPPVPQSEVGTQTDTHLVESNIVTTYEWNEWQMRREALRLLNLRHKVSRTVQTIQSAFRRDQNVQKFIHVVHPVQTTEPRYTNTNQPSIFRRGMRGLKPHPEIDVLDLTRDPDCGVHNVRPSKDAELKRQAFEEGEERKWWVEENNRLLESYYERKK